MTDDVHILIPSHKRGDIVRQPGLAYRQLEPVGATLVIRPEEEEAYAGLRYVTIDKPVEDLPATRQWIHEHYAGKKIVQIDDCRILECFEGDTTLQEAEIVPFDPNRFYGSAQELLNEVPYGGAVIRSSSTPVPCSMTSWRHSMYTAIGIWLMDLSVLGKEASLPNLAMGSDVEDHITGLHLCSQRVMSRSMGGITSRRLYEYIWTRNGTVNVPKEFANSGSWSYRSNTNCVEGSKRLRSYARSLGLPDSLFAYEQKMPNGAIVRTPRGKEIWAHIDAQIENGQPFVGARTRQPYRNLVPA